jgi:hypothetical protein
MFPCGKIARLFGLTLVSLICALSTGSAQATQTIDEFILVNSAPGTRVVLPVASGTSVEIRPADYAGFSPEQAVLVAKLEAYLGEVARYYQNMGFAAPRLDIVDGRNGGQAYVIHLYDYPDKITHAQYEANSMYMEIDLSRAFEGENVSHLTLETMAHELFHAIQRAYKDSEAAYHGDWIIEGQAQAMGMQAAWDLWCIDVNNGKSDDYRLGGREYFRPLPTNVNDATYRTSSFWRYLAETRAVGRGERACVQSSQWIEADYRYMTVLFEGPFDPAGGDDADLTWLDQGLREATGNGLAYHYGRFTPVLADYVPSRLTKPPGGTPEQAQDKWLNYLFGPCPMVTLTATSISGTATALLRKNGARCFKVTAEAPPAAAPARPGSGAAMLRKLRGQSDSGADSSVDLVVQARSAKRSDLEALWLGMVGGEDAQAAYIGRDRDGYMGDWLFSMPAGKSKAFVISNMAEDPTETIEQDVTLTVYTSAGHMTGSASGVGGPIDLKFHQFPQKDILSTLGETQTRAGIEKPCMIRLLMRTAGDDAELALQMDNDGRIQPGVFSVSKGAAPEKVPGQFVGGFSFGRGAERVGYDAEGGTVELTAFSPHILKGKASLLGRLPKPGYMDEEEESPWPQTMSVQTEFTVVPRVNMGSNLFKNNFCFEPAGED